MYCKNCGKEIESGEFCAECSNTTIVNGNEKIEVVQEVKNTNTTSNTTNDVEVSSKSKIAAGILGILLGSLGVHNFYLGYNGKAIAQLLISLLSCGTLAFVSAIWGLIEGIIILTSETKDADGKVLKN